MQPIAENPVVLGLRSGLFHLCSACVTAVFLLCLPLAWAPMWVGWPILRAYVHAQLWLLRVICGQGFVLDRAAMPLGAPVILAGRHEALWETLVLPVMFDNPVVFLKEEILRYPVAGAIARRLGHIGLDRSGSSDRARAAFAEARLKAEEGRNFLIFPNGTRNPEHRYRVQRGVAILYRALKLPCVPIVLDSGTFWPYKSWLRRPGVITVRVLPPIPAGLRTAEFLDRLKADLATPA